MITSSKKEDSLFRKPALESVGESPFVDALSSDSSPRRAIFAMIVAALAFCTLVSILFVPVSSVHSISGRIIWFPKAVAIRAPSSGTVNSVEVDLHSKVRLGQTLAKIGPETSFGMRFPIAMELQKLDEYLAFIINLRTLSDLLLQHLNKALKDPNSFHSQIEEYLREIVAKIEELELKAADLPVTTRIYETKNESNTICNNCSNNLIKLAMIIQSLKFHAELLSDQQRSDISNLILGLFKSTLHLITHFCEIEIERIRFQRAQVSKPQEVNIETSVTGRVLTLPPTIGQLLTYRETVLRILPSSSKLIVEAEVPGAIAAQLHAGTKVVISFPTSGLRRSRGIDSKVESLSASRSTESGYLARFTLEPEKLPSKFVSDQLAGMSVKVHISSPPIRLIDLITR